jgi:hypothetical protein
MLQSPSEHQLQTFHELLAFFAVAVKLECSRRQLPHMPCAHSMQDRIGAKLYQGFLHKGMQVQ